MTDKIDPKAPIGLNYHIHGKSYRFHFHPQRFEKTVDRVDDSVASGKSIDHIKAKYAQNIHHIEPVGHSGKELEQGPVAEPKKTASVSSTPKGKTETGESKASIAAGHAKEHPDMGHSDLVKHLKHHMAITDANARYHANNLRPRGGGEGKAPSTPRVKPAGDGTSKAEQAADHATKNPDMSHHELVKHLKGKLNITDANARYYAQKHRPR